MNDCGSNERLCIRIGLTESSNMLHYSNASSIEKNRRYLVIKGGGGLPGCSGKREGTSTPLSNRAGGSFGPESTGEKRGKK